MFCMFKCIPYKQGKSMICVSLFLFYLASAHQQNSNYASIVDILIEIITGQLSPGDCLSPKVCRHATLHSASHFLCWVSQVTTDNNNYSLLWVSSRNWITSWKNLTRSRSFFSISLFIFKCS